MYLKKEMQNNIISVLQQYKVTKASIFGSYARGDATEESDIDILVELSRKSLLDLVGIKVDLEEILNKKVDKNTFNGLNYSTRIGLKEQVLKDQVRII
ncbi:MAG: nucleotidyltransferase family protein [Halanaerobiales bacterium]|nr:nucleotidyltransferase family protein [Halanaerobiales bacterium]